MKEKLRCAVYTRKSSEEGLEQDFNSLDAQREACLAYIQSQKGEGWTASTRRYDDGGWSGGSMERPALTRLLADIEAGHVNVVVVYKVDRLTRSLNDFARIVDTFDRKGVSFVSVTQAFNTTSSMGRLTLNVLLSFAQFEREVTGERIRDKIAASKAKGMWMGGTPPLGYAPKDRTLEILQEEAEIVRHIFRRYLELRSVNALVRELDEQGIRSKRYVTVKGEAKGGGALSRGAIYYMLRNRIYLGEIVHKDLVHPGQHPAIVDRETFEAVETLLCGSSRQRTAKLESNAPLAGLLFDADGNRMTPTHSTGRSGQRYRYYTSAPLQRGGAVAANVTPRVPARRVEALLLDRLRTWSARPDEDWPTFLPWLKRVELHQAALCVTLAPPAHERWTPRIDDTDTVEILANHMLRVTIANVIRSRGGRTWLTGDRAATSAAPDRALVSGLRRGHQVLARAGIDLLDRTADFAAAKGIDDPYGRAIAATAFLAPDIQLAILEGRQPRGTMLEDLLEADLPLCWDAQRRTLGM